jgi:hypothetical protein
MAHKTRRHNPSTPKLLSYYFCFCQRPYKFNPLLCKIGAKIGCLFLRRLSRASFSYSALFSTARLICALRECIYTHQERRWCSFFPYQYTYIGVDAASQNYSNKAGGAKRAARKVDGADPLETNPVQRNINKGAAVAANSLFWMVLYMVYISSIARWPIKHSAAAHLCAKWPKKWLNKERLFTNQVSLMGFVLHRQRANKNNWLLWLKWNEKDMKINCAIFIDLFRCFDTKLSQF